MSAFDLLEERTTLREIANEWITDGGSSNAAGHSPALDLNATFEDGLRRVTLCYEELKASVARGDRNVYATAAHALGEAVRQVAALEVRLSDLLALRGDEALLVLDALQTYLDVIPEQHPRRRGAIHLIIKLADRSQQFPRSLYFDGAVVLPGATYIPGGFGDVYKGFLEGRPVAVKSTRVATVDPFALKRLCREALLWRQLRHQNILALIGLNISIYPNNPLPALLSPWMEYGSLRDYVKRPEYNARHDIPLILLGIAEGVQYLHSLAITHGDIKHLNILMDDLHCPRLADFGLVRLDDAITSGGFTQTSSGYDLRWTSPQRLQGEERSLPDDVYAFGCVGYYLYSGLVPFQGVSDGSTVLQVVQGKRPARPTGDKECILEPEDSMWDMISRSWSQDCSTRPNMTTLCDYLRPIGAGPGLKEEIQSDTVHVLEGHTDWVTSVSCSPNGASIVSGSCDMTVRVWDSRTGAQVRHMTGHRRAVEAVAFSPDGAKIASCSTDNSVRVWNALTGHLVYQLSGVCRGVLSVAFSHNGDQIVVGTEDSKIHKWKAETGQVIGEAKGHQNRVVSVAYAPTGLRMTSGSFDKTICVWQGASRYPDWRLTGHEDAVTSVAFSPDGRHIISGSHDKTVRIWDAKSGKALRTLAEPGSSVTSVAVSSDGAHIIIGCVNKTVQVWDAKTSSLVHRFHGHRNAVTSVACSADCTLVVSGSHDSTVRIWSM